MSYTQMEYLVLFLPIVLLLYQIFPKKHRSKILLVASYFFFFTLSRFLIVYILAATVVTHFLAKQIESHREKETTKTGYYLLAAFLLLGTLLILKYHNFFISNAAALLNHLGTDISINPLHFFAPVGISFYTIEAIGYLLEVKWGRIKTFASLEKTALFLCYFPKLMEGPICRYSDFNCEEYEYADLTHENLKRGMLRIFWGLLKKIVIADRMAIMVNNIFNKYTAYHGIIIAFGAVAYTIQLYMEFSGVMDIVLGSSQMFGITLPENFRQPFFSKNATEFWQRWHITLGVWLKNYVFYPVSVSKTVKKWNQYGRKKFGKFWTRFGTSAMALFPVWLFNGLWHGAQWNYIFYGMYYFVILLLETALEPEWRKWMKKMEINMKAGWYRAGQTVRLLIIVFIGEMFFRANSLSIGFSMFASMFQNFDPGQLFNGTLLALGADWMDLWVIVLGIIAVFIFDIIREKGTLTLDWLDRKPTPIRWSVYYALILTVILLGAYGDGYKAIDLIYAGF